MSANQLHHSVAERYLRPWTRIVSFVLDVTIAAAAAAAEKEKYSRSVDTEKQGLSTFITLLRSLTLREDADC